MIRFSKLLQKGFFGVLFIFPGLLASGQVQVVTGTIYDQTQRIALRGVSVMGTSGGGTATDSLGHYSIRLPLGDSIFFSYLGRETVRFPVKYVTPGVPLDMSMQVATDSLPSVLVKPRNYLTDSIENRLEYQKVFDYGSSPLTGMKSNRGKSLGVGIDFDLILNPKKNRQMLALQKRLEEEEQDKYIDHKWSKPLIRKITGLEPPALDTFMRQYRPTREFIESCETEYEYYHYIQEWGKFFADDWKQAHPQNDR